MDSFLIFLKLTSFGVAISTSRLILSISRYRRCLTEPDLF